MSQIDWKQLGVQLQMQDRIHQLSLVLCNGRLDELPHPDNASVQSLDGPEQLPEHVTTPTITSVEGHSNSATSLHQDQPCATIQSTTPNAISNHEMPKRTAESAGLSSSSFDDPFKANSSPQSQDVGSSHGPEHETADGSGDIPGTQNKRTKMAGSSQSFSKKEQPKPSNIAGSSQQAIIQNHGAESTQQHQPINSYATDMQVDEGPTQSPSGAMASAGSRTLGDWANVRAELEGLPKFQERFSSGHPGTSSSHEPGQKASTVAHRTKPQRSSEKHAEQAARASRPDDPFSSNHKDHAKKVAKRADSNLEAILDSDSDSDEAQLSKGKNILDFLSPYDDDWHTAQAQAAELASIHESTIQHEGKTLTYIKIPWAGRPGWIESYVDETALEYLSSLDQSGFLGYAAGCHGRRGRPTLAQLKENQRKRLEEEPVDVLVGDDETCDSIIGEMVKREERKRKGKGKGK